MTTKKTRRPAAKKKPARKITKSQPVKVSRIVVTEPPIVSQDEADIFKFVEAQGGPATDAPIVLDELSHGLPGSDELGATARLKPEASKAKPAKKPASGKAGPANVFLDMLRPDALKDLLLQINDQLVAKGSLWGCERKEAIGLAEATVAVVDKYFPDISKFGVEITAIALAVIYATPRIMNLRGAGKEAEPAEPEASGSVTVGRYHQKGPGPKIRKVPIVRV